MNRLLKTRDRLRDLSPRQRAAILGFLLLALNILLYSPSLKFGFYLDDHRLITNNTRIVNLPAFLESWDELYFRFPDFPFLHYWRPFSMFTFMVDYQVWGLNPSGYHLLNLLLNALAALFLFLIFREVNGRETTALVVALAYSFHPAKVSAVTWISGRTDLLAALLVFMSVYFYQRFLRGHTLWPYLAAILAFILGLLSKEIVFLLPFFLLGMVLYYRFIKDQGERSGRWLRRQLFWLVPPLILDGVYLAIHRSITGIGQGFFRIGIDELLVSLKALGVYLRLILVPFTRSPYYYMQDLQQHGALYLILALAFLGFLVLLITRLRDKFPHTLFAGLFLLFLAPLLNLYIMPSYPKILPRFAMIATVFAGSLYFETGELLSHRNLRRVYRIFLVLFFALMAIKVVQFQPYFQDDETNIRRRLSSTVEDVPLLSQKAIYAMKRGEFLQALAYADQALLEDQRDPWIDNADQIYNIRANILLLMGRIEEARHLIHRLIRTTDREDIRYYARILLAKTFEKQGDLPRALKTLRELDQYGDHIMTLKQKIVISARMGDFSRARALLQKLEKLNPNREEWENLKEYIDILEDPSADRSP